MQLYSTKNKNYKVSLQTAVMQGLPPDNGLYMPEHIAPLSADFFKRLPEMDLPEIGFEICKHLFEGCIPEADLRDIVAKAMTFPATIVPVQRDIYSLELWHGPSLAFKDFGARFMAALMSYFNRGNDQKLTILVATSGDTGGAVANGFYQTEGIEVVILYPSGKVSNLQEKQLTTLGHNIRALEVQGTFDDCQALVKQAFLDAELKKHARFSSANSINIARLIPQSFYYFEAYKQLQLANKTNKDVVFAIPSGNFGNLTAGLFAKRMGLPIQRFIAATNDNDVVPQYLQTGEYAPRPSVATLSNAMDVGAPSNFARMQDLYGSDWQSVRNDIIGYTLSDQATSEAIVEMNRAGYLLDPHGAVAFSALRQYQKNNDCTGVFLETAHPAKFLDDVERILDSKIDIPARLAALQNKEKVAVLMPNNYQMFKSWLLINV